MLTLLFALAMCSVYVSLVVRVFGIVVLWFKFFCLLFVSSVCCASRRQVDLCCNDCLKFALHNVTVNLFVVSLCCKR